MDTRPPNEFLVMVTFDDGCKMKAMRKDYKKRRKGKPLGWRWVDENSERLARNYDVDSWEYL